MEDDGASASSPASLSQPASGFLSPPRSKERRNPSITPRKFRRFFTPRPRIVVGGQPSAARRALRDLAAPALNRARRRSNRAGGGGGGLGTPPLTSPMTPLLEVNGEENDEDDDDENDENDTGNPAARSRKRRKTSHHPTPPRTSSPTRGPPSSPTLGAESAGAPSGRRAVAMAAALLSPIQSMPRGTGGTAAEVDADDDDDDDASELELEPDAELGPRRVAPLATRGFAGQLLQRELGCMPRAGRQFMRYPVGDWRTEVADFQSQPKDMYFSSRGGVPVIPFCVAACNKSSLVAVGGEDGSITLLDTRRRSINAPTRVFPAHGNAIIDLDWSADDSLLATASGDQTGKVMDASTLGTVAMLSHHSATMKQVRFQPGRAAAGSVLATSSRDGAVHLWDLRCRGGPVTEAIWHREAHFSVGGYGGMPPGGRATAAAAVVNSIYDAHGGSGFPSSAAALSSRRLLHAQQQQQQSHSHSRSHQPAAPPGIVGSTAGDTPGRGEMPGRVGDVSVTAVHFLGAAGRDHLLLTACEADASLKLWDVRCIQPASQRGWRGGGHGLGGGGVYGGSVPLSYTEQPAMHTTWRPFGISGVAVSSDGGRVYALCKDNTVYAYSTAHLMLGRAPELSTEPASETFSATSSSSHPVAPPSSHRYPPAPPRPRRGLHHHPPASGLGPLYGLRHPQLHATSFYVKLSLRPARHGRSELLAAGSSDGCAVVFPTDERLWRPDLGGSMPSRCPISQGGPASSFSSSFQPMQLQRTSSFTAVDGESPLPIVSHVGAALVRGHAREVGALCWTGEHDDDDDASSASSPRDDDDGRGGGKLVTAGDDCVVRVWGEDRGLAATLRYDGEGGGRRWNCGWADLGDSDEPDSAAGRAPRGGGTTTRFRREQDRRQQVGREDDW